MNKKLKAVEMEAKNEEATDELPMDITQVYAILKDVKHDYFADELSSLVPSPWNAPGRDDPARMKSLIESVMTMGNELTLIDVVLLNDKRRMIADGHRRWMASKEAGKKTIGFTLWDARHLSVEEGLQVVRAVYWLKARLSRGHSPSDLLRAALLGMAPMTKKHIEYRDFLLDAYGPEKLRAMVLAEAQQTVPSTLAQSFRFTAHAFPKECADGSRPTVLVQTVLEWMLSEPAMVQRIKDALASKSGAGELQRMVKKFHRYLKKRTK